MVGGSFYTDKIYFITFELHAVPLICPIMQVEILQVAHINK